MTDTKTPLLFLAHRIPYPPNKGDKIASFNMLKHLSQHFSIYLGCFIDDPTDWQYIDKLKEYCTDVCVQALHPKAAKIASIRGLFMNQPLSLPYYRNRKLQQWTDRVIEQTELQNIYIFSGVMVQYVSQYAQNDRVTVLDLVDVDSDKWRLYAEKHRWPMSWLYDREAKQLLKFERAMSALCTVTVFVSQQEANYFRQLAPEVADKVTYRNQGVDAAFFNPSLDFISPYQEDEKPLVFVGAMDYWPNADAAIWFATEIFPAIREQIPQAKFYVVGMNPTEKVQQLADIAGIVVTGAVDDVRTYVAHATLSVAPLRIARGIQNKVLEAMAMEKTVVATENALQGIDISNDCFCYQQDSVAGFSQKIVELLQQENLQNCAGREIVLQQYDWSKNLQAIAAYFVNSNQSKH